MKKLRMSLLVLTVIASCMLGMVAMAEARDHNRDYNDNYYSQHRDRNHHAYDNHNRYDKPRHARYVKRQPARRYTAPPRHARYYYEPQSPPPRYAKHHRVRYVKHHNSHHHDHDRYLYPALIGAGVGLLVLGLAH